MRWRGAAAGIQVELRKLAGQAKVWAVLLACVAAPWLFVAVVVSQSGLPTDTLFGRQVKASGFAAPLVILGFSSQWALPALASVVGGDVFSSEDRLGAWPTLLTRSVSRAELFVAKALVALGFAVLAVALLGASSACAGVAIVGKQPLLGLTGTFFAPRAAARAVALAWASVVPPTLAFTAVALMLSVVTRSSAAGVGLPVVLGLLLELGAMTNAPSAVARVFLTTAFHAWHGLLADPGFSGPLVQGGETSLAYGSVALAGAWATLRRREARA